MFPTMKTTDLVIVGQGPAGLSAAIYGARAGIDTVAVGLPPKIDGEYDIDNYFGFDETVSGSELMARGRQQALRFGANLMSERVLGIHHGMDGAFEVKTEHNALMTKSVILATGVSRMRPGIHNLDSYEGKGISYCVSCDGFFYRGKPVMVLGEGNYAANQALELLSYTDNVSVCTQGKQPTMTDEFVQKIAEAKIPVIPEKIKELQGSPALEGVIFDSGKTRAIDGIFVAMGEASASDFAWTLGVERSGIYIKTDDFQRTNVDGIFAAGDCVGRFLQVAVAVGEGALAAREAISHVKKVQKEKSAV